MSEFTKNLISLITGWLLGLVTQQIGWVFRRWQQKRKVLTRLHRLMEEILIDLEIQRASKEAGVLQTFEGYFDVDESWTQKLPHKPPLLPEDFQRVLEEFSDWEAQRGKYVITKKLYNLQALINQARAVYFGLAELGKSGHEITERPLKIYASTMDALKERTSEILDVTWPSRLNLYQRARRRLRNWAKKRQARKPPAS